jgi:hypothetical protein
MAKGKKPQPSAERSQHGVMWGRLGSNGVETGGGGIPSRLKVQVEGRKAVLLELLELSKLKIQKAVMAIHKSILFKTLR